MAEGDLVGDGGIQQDQVVFADLIRDAADLIDAAALGNVVALQKAVAVEIHGVIFPVAVDVGHIRIQRSVGQMFKLHTLSPFAGQGITLCKK